MDDPYNLQRFVGAQNPLFEQICAELRQGRKTSHWMWFIFPQIHGLGSSETARYFAISSRAEATAYLEHPIFRPAPATVHPARNGYPGKIHQADLRLSGPSEIQVLDDAVRPRDDRERDLSRGLEPVFQWRVRPAYA